jgi:type IV secretory pathway TrbL component
MLALGTPAFLGRVDGQAELEVGFGIGAGAGGNGDEVGKFGERGAAAGVFDAFLVLDGSPF